MKIYWIVSYLIQSVKPLHTITVPKKIRNKKNAKLWLKEERFCFNNSSFVFRAYLDERGEGCKHEWNAVLFARKPTARAQSSNLRSSSLGHLLTGFHWEQDARLDSKSVHPHHSFFPSLFTRLSRLLPPYLFSTLQFSFPLDRPVIIHMHHF